MASKRPTGFSPAGVTLFGTLIALVHRQVIWFPPRPRAPGHHLNTPIPPFLGGLRKSATYESARNQVLIQLIRFSLGKAYRSPIIYCALRHI